MNSTPGMCARFWRLPVTRLSTTRTRSPRRDELFREVRTDEAGAAGDEIEGHNGADLSKKAAAPVRLGADRHSVGRRSVAVSL